MILDPASAPHLKPWLSRTLEPICDAEPNALADYILALLKHNVPESEMKKELISQLEEFLESECGPFVETLFTALRTKSYLPYAPPSPPQQSGDEGVSKPFDTIMAGAAGPSSERTRKRSSSSDGRDGRPRKGPRLSNDVEFAGHGWGGGGWDGQQQFGEFSPGGMEGFGIPLGPMGMGMPVNGMPQMGSRHPQGYQPPGQKRGICRDYHNHGFCARGEMCKFSHGEGAVVPSQLYPMNPGVMDFNMFYNMMSQNNPNIPYDPNDPQTNRQNQRAPIIPRIQQGDGSSIVHPQNASGELPVIQDLTPSDAAKKQAQQQQQQQANGQPDPAVLAAMVANGFDPSMFHGMPSFPGMQMLMDPSQQMPLQEQNQAPGRPPSGFRGRGRGRGGFGSEAAASRPPRRGDKTLVVEKIPHDKLSHEGIVEWFKKFGDVTNVAVDRSGTKALVSFATHEEAHKAWKAEDAVFGNRFVKVFWHRPMEGHGQIGQRALAASQGIVANLKTDGQRAPATSVTPPQIASSTSTSTNGTKKPLVQPTAASALAAKQNLLEKHISEQKALMAAFSATAASTEEKKRIMDRLRALGKEMEETKASATAIPASVLKKAPSAMVAEMERERLDKELENRGGGGGGETTEELKAKLEKLKAEAASLGIADGAEASYGGGFRGGYRGRVRGTRGGYNYRGGPVLRGAPPRGSMKLDNRPKRLLVKGVPSGEEGVQAVKDWYSSTGQVDSIESADEGVAVAFQSRAAAEQALAKGSILPIVGKVSITWYIPSAKPTPLANGPSTPVAASPTPQPAKDIEFIEPTPSSHRQEDEIVASGWGDEDGDDGMGMQ
ncbi:hypothetical protein FA13DRAFT_1751719 [Coprinellus micaceus]|uniref:C3H1-type domain-containing protein n=1 Tax=Coprinellus micaceus TaxID=71717 RepID=A0A4Y7TYQ6_COPMI|nr:hypothetical protein FA13DRAFT_1751719 [Coprinellus micaceus]